jgi:hypothetical protein
VRELAFWVSQQVNTQVCVVGSLERPVLEAAYCSCTLVRKVAVETSYGAGVAAALC